MIRFGCAKGICRVRTKSGDNSRGERAQEHAQRVARDLNALVRGEQPEAAPPEATPPEATPPSVGQGHYAVLGVAQNATAEQIENAYHAKAKKYGPERNPGSELFADAYKKATEAYAVLKDPIQRQVHDSYLVALSRDGPKEISDYAGFLKKSFPALFPKDADLSRLADDQRVRQALLDDPDALVEVLLLNYRSEPAENISRPAINEMAQIHKQLSDFIGATLKDKAPRAPAVRKALETRFLYEFTHRDFGRTRQALNLFSLLEPVSDELLIAVFDVAIRDAFDMDGENTFESAENAIRSLWDEKLTKSLGFYRTFFERYLTLERAGRLEYYDWIMSIDLGREMKMFIRSLFEKDARGIEPLLVEFVPQIKDPEMKAISLIHLSRSEDAQKRALAVPPLRAMAADPALDYNSVREPAALALLHVDSGDKAGIAFLHAALVGSENNVYGKASLAAELLKGNPSDRAAMRFLLGGEARENTKAMVVAAAFFPQNKGAIERLIAEIGRKAAKPSTLSELGYQLNQYQAAESVVDEFVRHRDAVPEDDREHFDQKVAALRARQIPTAR